MLPTAASRAPHPAFHDGRRLAPPAHGAGVARRASKRECRETPVVTARHRLQGSRALLGKGIGLGRSGDRKLKTMSVSAELIGADPRPVVVVICRGPEQREHHKSRSMIAFRQPSHMRSTPACQ